MCTCAPQLKVLQCGELSPLSEGGSREDAISISSGEAEPSEDVDGLQAALLASMTSGGGATPTRRDKGKRKAANAATPAMTPASSKRVKKQQQQEER